MKKLLLLDENLGELNRKLDVPFLFCKLVNVLVEKKNHYFNNS
jgi:hypothetical protein